MKQVGSAQVYLLALVLIGLTGMLVVEPWIVRCAFLLIIVFCGYTASSWKQVDWKRSGVEAQATRTTRSSEVNCRS